jgi:hypothetical protein
MEIFNQLVNLCLNCISQYIASKIQLYKLSQQRKNSLSLSRLNYNINKYIPATRAGYV